MCDFSCYGGPSDEWINLAATLPEPPPADVPLPEQQRRVNEDREATAAEEMKSLRHHVHLRDYSIPTKDGSSIDARSYRTTSLAEDVLLPVYIHLHGGGFLFGTLSSEDAVCTRIALEAQVVVVNVNYRHTPDYTYPTAWDDVRDAFEWIHANIDSLKGQSQKVVIGGISAGGHLAASLTLEKHLGRSAVSCPPIAGQVLMIPCLVNVNCYGPQLEKLRDPSVSSYVENKDAPILSLARSRFITDLLKIGDLEVGDTRLNIGNATTTQVKGLPPTVFGIAGLDPLRDEALLYAKLLTEARYVLLEPQTSRDKLC
jgi:acetyl esterase/lipase